MLLSIQQKYILEVLRKLGCVQRGQLQTLTQGKFTGIGITEQRMDAMLRQLRNLHGDVRLDAGLVSLSGVQPDHRRLEAVDVMLELAEDRLLDFTAVVHPPELLRFSLEGSSLRLFTVTTLSNPLHSSIQTRDSPGRTVWLSDSGAPPDGLTLPPKHFFAARQPDGSHRFYGS